jgi:hypothetical protein
MFSSAPRRDPRSARGSPARSRIRKPIEGVRLVTTLDEMVQLVKEWRAQRFVY